MNARKLGDTNQLAAFIVQQATHEGEPEAEQEDDTRNPAAVALGKLGGKKGGPARARSLTPQRRSEIAKKAAAARWRKTA